MCMFRADCALPIASYALQSHLKNITFRPEFEYICIISHCLRKVVLMQ